MNCNQCQKGIGGGNKKVLKCGTCHIRFHATCLDDWKDMTADQLKVLTMPGVTWYCSTCHPTLSQYIHAPNLEKKLDHHTTELQAIKRLVTESIQQSRDSFEQTKIQCTLASRHGEAAARIGSKLAEDMRNKHDMEEAAARRRSAILYGVQENLHLEDHLLNTADKINFKYRSLQQSFHLGNPNRSVNQMRPRPVKLVFESELAKNQFMSSYNRWDERGTTFAKPDLTKEQRDIEYKLRQKRNELKARNSHKNYRIRLGKIWEQSGVDWFPVDEVERMSQQNSHSPQHHLAGSPRLLADRSPGSLLQGNWPALGATGVSTGR